jgi:hypothetical protein
MAGARFVGHRLLPAERPSFYDWQHDAADVQRAFDWPLEGLLFDIELNRMWLPS